MSLEATADALIALRLELVQTGRFAVDLAEARDGRGEQQRRFRNAMTRALADVLRVALPGVKPTKALTMAQVIQHTLRGVPTPPFSTTAERQVLAEFRTLIAIYLAAAPSSRPASPPA